MNTPDDALEAAAQENARLRAQIERLLKEAEGRDGEIGHRSELQSALYRIADAASAASDMQQFYAAMHRIIGELMYAENLFIALYDDQTDLITWPYYVDTVDTESPEPVQLKDFEGATGWVLRNGRAIAHVDGSLDAAIQQEEMQQVGSVSDGIGIPLLHEGHTIGVLAVQSYKESIKYDRQDLDVLNFAGQHISTALTRARAIEGIRQRNAELAILNSVGEAMAQTLDVKTVTRIVGDKVRDILDASNIFIDLLDTDEGIVRNFYGYNKSEGGYIDDDFSYPLGTGLSSKVILSRQPLLLGTLAEQYANGGMLTAEDVQTSGIWAESWLGVPIIASDRVLGVVALGADPPHAFNQDQVRLLQTLSTNMGVAIENARLFDETERLLKATEQRNAELAIINSVQQALAAELNIQGIYDAVGDKIREIFHQGDVAIRIYDPKTNLLHYPYVYDQGNRISIDSHLLAERGIATHVLQSRETLVINEKMAGAMEKYGSQLIPGTEMEKSAVYVPLVTGDQARGIIDISNYERENAFSESDVRLLQTLANSMSVALENARLFDETQRLLKETERHAAELSLINSIQQGLAAELDFQAIVDLVGDKLREVFHSQDLGITWHDKKTNLIHYLYGYEHGVRQQFFTAAPRPGGPFERMVKTHAPVVWNTMEEGDAVSPTLPGTDSSKSGAFLPIISGDRVLGGMQIENYEQENAFGAAELRLLTTITASLGAALENAHLFDETQRLLKETEEHAAELAVINSVQEGLASRLEFQAIIDLVGDKITEIFASDATGISLYDRGENQIRIVYLWEDGTRLPAVSMTLGEGLTSRVISTKKPLLLHTSAEANTLGAVWVGLNAGDPEEKGAESALLVPMIAGVEVTGVISVQSYKPNAYGESQLRLLSTLSASMSVALQNARLFNETQRLFEAEQQRAAELAIINSVQAALAAELNIQGIYEAVGDKIRDIFHSADVGIRVFDPKTNQIYYPYAYEKGERIFIDPTSLGEKGFSAHVFRTRETLVINENMEEEAGRYGSYILPGTESSKSELFVPLIAGGQARGLINISDYEREHAFNPADVRLLQTLAGSMSVALENARLFDETQRLLKETEQRNAELAIINSVQAALAAELNIQGIYDAVGDKIREIFHNTDMNIRIYDPATNQIHYPYVYENGERLSLPSTNLGKSGFDAHVLGTRSTLVINEDMLGVVERLGSGVIPGTQMEKSAVYVPLLVGEQARGLINLSNMEREHAFSESDVRLLQTLANSMSVALENARLFDETQRLLKETEDRNAELAIINSVQAGLASRLDMQSIYDLVGNKICEVFSLQTCFIMIYDWQSNLENYPFVFENGMHLQQDSLPHTDEGFSPLVMRTRQPLMINEDLLERAAEVGSYALGDSMMSKSAMYVPLLIADDARGVISVQNLEREHAYTESDLRLLTTLASSVSVALESARLFDETQRLLKESEQRAAELAIINGVQAALAHELSVQGIYDAVGDKIREIFNKADVGIRIYDPRSNLVQYPYVYEGGVRISIEATPLRDTGFNAHVLRNRQPLMINENMAEEMEKYGSRVLPGTHFGKSMIMVPMVAGDQARGSVDISEFEREHAFSESDLRLLQTLANAMSVALENARLFDETQRLLGETEQRAAELAIVNSVQVALASKLDIQAIYELVSEKIREVFHVRVFDIVTYDPEKNLISMPYSYEDGDRSVMEPREPYGFRLHVIKTGEPLLVNTDTERLMVEYDNPVITGAIPKSLLFVPLLVGDQVRGVLSIQDLEKEATFRESDVRLMQTLANAMSVALENARLFDETQLLLRETERRNAELSVINSIQQGLASKLNTQAIIDLVGDKVTEIFGSDVTMISIVDRAQGTLHFPYFVEAGTRLNEEPTPIGSGFTSRVITGRQPVLFHTLAEARAGGSIAASVHAGQAGEREVESILAVPLVAGDEVGGAISVQSYKPHAFNDGHLRLLSTLTASMGVALQNARLFTETERLLEESRQRAAELAVINSVTEAMSSHLEAEAIIKTVGDRVRETFQVEVANIALYDPDSNMIHLPYTYDRQYTSTPPFSFGDGLTSRVIQSRQPLILGSFEEIMGNDAILTPSGPDDELMPQSYLGVPILMGERVLGVVDVQSYQRNAYNESHARLLSTLASSMGVALENARLYVDADRRGGQMAALAEAGQEISASHDLPAIMENIARRAHEVCHARTTVLRLAEPDGKTYRAVAALGMYAEQHKAELMHAGEGVTGAILRSGQAEIIPDLESDPRTVHVTGTPEEEEQAETMMLAPLVVRGRSVGVLTLYRWKAEGQFTPVDLDFLSGLARQAAIAIENVGLLEAAQESRRRLADIIDFLPDATLVIDRAGRVIAWNRSIEEMTGVKAEHVIGRADYEYALPFYGERRPILIDLVLREDQALERQYEQVERRGSVLVGEAVVPNLRGHPAYLYATASALRDAKGETVGAIETIRDISDRKQAEQELRQAKAEAEAATQAKSAFLATMSHEIRTPMNAIIGMSGLLLNTDLNAQQQEFAEIIRNSGDALLGIINDILDFSKIEAGRLELEYTTFDLRECLESALDLMAPKAAEKGIDLAIEVAPGAPAAIVSDVTRLRQVAINLLNNAVKFTEKGEVVLSVEAGARTGEAGLLELHFSVRDTGIGIPADRLDRLFQSFSQVDASTSRKYGGTGLGLAISRRLVEMMGGRVWVESEVGRGSVFHFTIQAQPVALDVRTRFHGEQPRFSGRRLLVVDDNPTNRRILRLQMQDWGMIACETGSAGEALEWVRRGDPFDAAILDLHMPEMDGAALGAEIRKVRDDKSLPLVMLSSMGGREEAGDQVEWAAYLTKPIKQSQLFNVLAGIFGRVEEHPAPQPATQPSRPDAQMAAHWPLEILLAEDNAYNQKLASLLLGQMGYRADVASNGLEAIQAVQRQHYDVILMDVQMPEMDGLEATRQICARWPANHPYIIAMTANAMQGDREMCLAAGMQDYLSKPIRVNELAAALQRAGSTISHKDVP